MTAATQRVPAITEKAFQEAVIEAASYLGWRHFHPYEMRKSDPGWPDLVLVRPPRLLFVELKSENGKVTDAQQEWMYVLTGVPGVEVYVWRPLDWDLIEEMLR